jgi:ferredoxin
MNVDLYELVRGPLMSSTLILFIAGLGYRVFQFFKATTRLPRTAPPINDRRTVKQRVNETIKAVPRILRRMRTHYRNSIFGMTPVTMWLTVVYHVILVLAVCFTQGHNVLLDLSWGFSFPSIPEKTMDLLTLLMIAVSLYYLLRRAFSAKLKFPHIFRDYLAILATAAPFVTGFIAYHQWFDYRTTIICHMLSGQLMLIALLYTKLGHIIFFFFGRIYLHGELNLTHGSRAWMPDQDLKILPGPVSENAVDVNYIRHMLDQKKTQMKIMLQYCARCSNCANSCFLYVNTRDASYIPSQKVFASLGKLYSTNGKVQRQDLKNMVDPLWNKCVLCDRCYCPVGLKIPEMISLARTICRSQGVYKTYDA